MTVPETVRIAFIRRAVGLRGEVEVELLTDRPERFRAGAKVLAGGAARVLERASGGGAGLRLKFAGVDDRTAADRLRGAYVEVDVAEVAPLAAGHFYHWQLLGLKVLDPEGKELGAITDILEYPANDVYVVSGGSEVMVPALASVVREVDVEGGRMVVELPPEEVVE